MKISGSQVIQAPRKSIWRGLNKHTILSKNEVARTACVIAILHKKCSCTGRLEPDAKPPDLAIPNKYIPVFIGFERFYNTFGQSWHFTLFLSFACQLSLK